MASDAVGESLTLTEFGRAATCARGGEKATLSGRWRRGRGVNASCSFDVYDEIMPPFARPASIAWEPLTLRADPAAIGWAWYFPPTAPQTVQIQIPPQSVQRLGERLTIQALLESLPLAVDSLQGWEQGGTVYELDAGAAARLNQPLSVPPAGPLVIHLRLREAAGRMATGVASPMVWRAGCGGAETTTLSGVQALKVLESLEADWLAIVQIERNLEAIRKQFASLQGRLQALNRDLSPEEFRAADNQDRKDWLDARRWLRAASDQLSRYIREYDIGVVSDAGGRLRFEEFYRNHIQPRRPCEGLSRLQLEFEQYRRTHLALLQQMQGVFSNAQRDGEQRAQQVLHRIAAKVRAVRTKR